MKVHLIPDSQMEELIKAGDPQLDRDPAQIRPIVRLHSPDGSNWLLSYRFRSGESCFACLASIQNGWPEMGHVYLDEDGVPYGVTGLVCNDTSFKPIASMATYYAAAKHNRSIVLKEKDVLQWEGYA